MGFKKIIGLILIFLLLLFSYTYADDVRTCNVLVCNYTEEDALFNIYSQNEMIYHGIFRSNSCISTIRLPKGEYDIFVYTLTGGAVKSILSIADEQLLKCRQSYEGSGNNLLIEIVMQEKEFTI